MPTLFIKTNVPRAKFPECFMKEMTEIMSNTLGKPTKFICVIVEADSWMVFGDSNEPCAVCRLTCLGKLSADENVKHSKVIMSYLNEKVGIEDDRMYIEFCDVPRADMGYKSTTFGAM